MRLEHEFKVGAPPQAVWPLLLDLERVAPCFPGAESVERVDEGAFRVGVTVRLGPMKLTYRGDVAVVEADEGSRRAVIGASASEARGQGTARATIETTLVAENGGTRARVVTDLHLTGRVAQMGRGMVEEVSSGLLREFVACLARKLEAPGGEEPPARPIRGLRHALAALWARLRSRR